MKQDGTARITLKVTASELELLTALVSDQLFRREFIDPKMPGYKCNTAELSLGKSLLGRLRALKENGYGNGKAMPTAKAAG